MLRINCTLLFIGMLFVGCAGQNGLYSVSDDFDQNKAAQNRISLGLTYLRNGNYSQAKFNLDKALEFAPRSADVNYAMAYYYQRVEEIDKAENAYQFAMDLEPKNADIINSYGAFLCENGNYPKAKEYFLKAVNTSNYISSAETYENLAICSRSLGYPEDAIGYLRSAVNHQPGRSNSLYLLVEALIDTQQWQEARDVLRRYERIAQVSPESLLMAIKIEKGSNNYAAAKDYTDMLVKVYPTHPEVIALLKAKDPVAMQPKKVQKVLKIQKPTSDKPLPLVDTVSAAKQESVTNKADVVIAENTQSNIESENKLQASYHIVAKGENLYRISLMYNIKMQRLVEWNNLSKASAIYNGMKLSLVSPNSDE
ncbi:type IV pilus biogenesis/stability protein PilW [Paraglaciecola sp. L3A3]|uniref:type IV pilus biogenesis/stability protein PilW n=1 Tax=Paraglaciecola sp. L3A3 TaxID=2686358 RepID=UPI00131E3440|nr:type IV pilus biogenesis/stability protein PilW [Paraglaciecola sp. L3A3]